MYLSCQAIWMHVNVCMYKMSTSKIQFRNSKQRLFWLHTIISMIGKSLNYEYTCCMYNTHTYVDTYHTITHNSMYKMSTSKIQFRNSKQRLFWHHTIISMIGKSLNYEYTCCMYTMYTYVDTYNTITHNSMYKMSTSKIQFSNSKQRLFWHHTIILMIGKSLNYEYTCCMYTTHTYVDT